MNRTFCVTEKKKEKMYGAMYLKVSWMCIVFRKWGGLIEITSLQKKAKHHPNKVKHVRPS